MSRYSSLGLALVASTLMCMGCATVKNKLRKAPSPAVSLSEPWIDGELVSINGAARGMREPMVWYWGDGTSSESWFPARHMYAEEGRYRIRVRGTARIDQQMQPFERTLTVDVTEKTESKEDPQNIHRLSLGHPKVRGHRVTVNGMVVAPVDYIQWIWGDGVVDENHPFPASHKYKNAGTYQITVRTIDDKERTSEKSVTVTVE